MPAVTIVVATYDRPAWLAVALRSVQLSAAFAFLKGVDTTILVVDDASVGEDTRRVCDSFGVRYVRNRLNDGRMDPSAARALGIAEVDTEYFGFFDDDDVMLVRYVAAHVALAESGFDVVSSPYFLTDADLRPVGLFRDLPARLGDMVADHNMVNDYSVVRTARAQDVWRPELGKAMPFGAWLELAYRGAAFAQLDEPTFLYRRHGDNMSTGAAEDPTLLATRHALTREYAERIARRDGAVPAASASLRARRAVPLTVRRAARRARDTLRKGRVARLAGLR